MSWAVTSHRGGWRWFYPMRRTICES